jgi:hypothetical protein
MSVLSCKEDDRIFVWRDSRNANAQDDDAGQLLPARDFEVVANAVASMRR